MNTPLQTAPIETGPIETSPIETDAHSQPPADLLLNRICAVISKVGLMLAIVGLIVLILAVQVQVVGRYIFNDTPTWTEALALQLVLYITALGVAVGVRDAGHIGLDSMVALLPVSMRLKIEILIHVLVAMFGGVMAWAGWIWTRLKWAELDPMLGIPEGVDYLALVIAGVLIVLFSFEHVIALLRGEEVMPSWH
ncbi:MAG: TRAP transporter small permease [Polaromonas sp.]|nr:TRAP transporter small permease [Polaromonas sp.]